MAQAKFQCNECAESFDDKVSLKNHKTNVHVLLVTVGESKQIVTRTEEGFLCPVCDKSFYQTRSFAQHMSREGLTTSIPQNRLSDRSNSFTEQISGSTFEWDKSEAAETSEYAAPLPSPLEIVCNTRTLSKRKRLNHSETILHSCGSLAAADDVKNDKLMLAKIGRWEPLVYETSDDEYGYLTSPKTASLMLQPNAPLGIWKSPILDDHVPKQPNLQSDSDTFIHHIKASSQAAKHLLGVSHTEMTTEHSTILNKDWLIYPQLRYCCPHLLAGAILVDGVNAILLNTVEPYSRDSLTDAHYERRLPNSPSSFPDRPGLYGFLNICLLSTTDGKKLVLGTRSCNMLVTSSMRLDIRSVNLGSSTTHFQPSRNTRVYLDKESIDAVSLMLISDSLMSAQTMPALYQLRQLRSKFHNLSTYIQCRASSSLASHLELQPATIWTLCDQDSPQATPSQEKIGSMLLRSIAVAAIRHGGNAVLHQNEVENLVEMTKDSVVGKILVSIIDLFDQSTLSVIKNQRLNAKLTDLAAAVSQGNARENKKKMNLISETFYDK